MQVTETDSGGGDALGREMADVKNAGEGADESRARDGEMRTLAPEWARRLTAEEIADARQMLDGMRAVAMRLGRTPKRREYSREPEGSWRFTKYFSSYGEFVRAAGFEMESRKRGATSWPLIAAEGRMFGDVLNYGAMLHEPVNEQGVVLLFGMMAGELGFLVESVRTGYPDCEGKRRVDGGKWERVRIEFEFRSGRFDHDVKGCDVIVCWEHDWKECPLEVIELKSVLKRIAA